MIEFDKGCDLNSVHMMGEPNGVPTYETKVKTQGSKATEIRRAWSALERLRHSYKVRQKATT